MNHKNTVFFSTSDNNYVAYAATSLLTIRRHIPEANLWVISRGLSVASRYFLEKNDIKYLEIDLSLKFKQTWDYPIECYYLFAGPEYFHRKGYEYSVYVDGDTIAASNPLTGLPSFKGIKTARQTYGKSTDIFGDDWSDLSKLWPIQNEVLDRPRLNTGVVYFNNEHMSNIGLLDKAAFLFEKCVKAGVPRKGDDSLFALLHLVYLDSSELEYLPPRYNYTQHHNPADGLTASPVFIHFTIDKPWKSKPYSHENRDLNIYNKYTNDWRATLRSTGIFAWLRTYPLCVHIFNRFETSLAVVKKIILEVSDPLRGVRLNIVARRVNRRRNPIRLYLWRSGLSNMYNFGDEVTKDIVGKIFGFRYTLADIDTCEMVGAGSILEVVEGRSGKNKITIWGSGLMKEDGAEPAENIDVTAVRGELTKERLDVNCAVGDPGILANIVYGRPSHRIDKIGFVAHYIDLDLPIVKEIVDDERFVLISPLEDPAIVAHNIASCKAILSSSLHGLIFADSYGVPNLHVELSDRVVGGGYKFRDYCSGVGRQYSRLESNKILNEDVYELILSGYTPARTIDVARKQLVKSFPY